MCDTIPVALACTLIGDEWTPEGNPVDTRLQVEEKELDTAKVSKAMTEINASQKAAKEAQRQR